MALKYIIFERPDGLQTVRLFDVLAQHIDVAQEVGLRVLSAGKCYRDLSGTGFVATQGSVSLKVENTAQGNREDTLAIDAAYRRE